MIRAWLPPRPIDAHKGTFGKAMLVAGSANYTGAAVLAATGAVRAGAGLVTLALPSELHTAVVPAIPEVTYLLLPHTLGVLNAHAVDVLKEELAGYTALLVGPGLSKTPETRAFVGNLFHARERKRSTGFIKSGDEGAPVSAAPELPPLVIDADGLNILSEMDNWHSHLPSGAILTPHPGEMARLTGLSTKEIQGDRLATARSWAETWQQVVVLKGAFTVIAGPGREPVVLPFANPGLSSAGTGDVLAGAVVALRAQGLDAFEAAVAGAYLHGLAGEIATARWGQAGTAARDVAAALAAAWRRLVA
jgi:NAD(P)H-hydrate epimerase